MDINPYESHPALSDIQSEVLWEYAKLAQHVKKLSSIATQLTDDDILDRLRVLERKMSLVLTLFKASVWGVINEQANTTTTTT